MLQYVVITSFVAIGILMLLALAGITRYDVREIQKQQARKRQPHSRRNRIRPMIGVVIVANNHEQTIMSVLDSIRASSYRKYQVVIIDNASADRTVRFAKDWQKNHPKQALRIIRKRRAGSHADAVKQAAKTGKGIDLWLQLRADQQLEPQALRVLATQSVDEPSIAMFVIKERLCAQYSVGGLFFGWQQMVNAYIQKTRPRQEASCYQPGIALRSESIHTKSDTQLGFYVAATRLRLYMRPTLRDWLVDYWRAATRRRAMARWQSQLVTLACLIMLLSIVVYSIKIALTVGEPTLLLVGWGGLMLVLSLALSDDTIQTRRQKMSALPLLPLALTWFVVGTFVQACAVLVSMPKRVV